MSVLSSVIENNSMENIVKEFSRLGDICYLDNTGAALYPESLIKRVNDDLLNNIYMNPHSDKYSQDSVNEVRNIILKYFNTDSLKYHVIFTSGATQTLKLITESFQFDNDTFDETKRGSFIHLRDNHTSVLGLRELAKIKDVNVAYISHENFLESLRNFRNSVNEHHAVNEMKDKGNNLFVYPAQNNFNGFKYPLNYMNEIKNGCLEKYLKDKCHDKNWYILLDAASFASTSRLDLATTQPDFVCLSFYKIFGYPTGLGALLVKTNSINLLYQKKYYGGGTVDIVLNTKDFHAKKQDVHERFEDGTTSFLSITTLRHCFDVMHSLIPKAVNSNIMDTISAHTYYLAKDLYDQLKIMKHNNGQKAVVFYMDSDFTDISKQGSIVTFNLLKDNGDFVGYMEFQNTTEMYNIRIRTGCFCNSGSCQRHFSLSNVEMKKRYEDGHNCGDEIDIIDGQPTGALRVSFGYFNTYNDVDKLMKMITKCYINNNYECPIRLDTHQNNLLSNVNSRKVTTNIFNLNTDNAESDITISDLLIYPVESCGAFKIKSSWKISQKGFEYDGAWKIVKDGARLEPKQIRKMSYIYPDIDIDRNCLTLNYSGIKPISISLDESWYHCQKNSDDCDCGNEVSNWLSMVLNISSIRLMRIHNNHNTALRNYSNNGIMPSIYCDTKIVLINTATVKWLNHNIIDSTIGDLSFLIEKLRGNIILETSQELIELEWKKVIISGHEFKVEDHCFYSFNDYKNNIDKNIIGTCSESEKKKNKLYFGLYLRYEGPYTGSKQFELRIQSKVTPIYNYEKYVHNYKEVPNDSIVNEIQQKTHNKKLSTLAKYLWNRGKKYDVTTT